ncbi:CLUMA_CG002425, isoform A [Clunio marinus]|uniref:CLUMA_CG002425, isoform A n=1 Tax=Clunio marinus TaxID=568069 RepID=A0A1J1HKM9_9DIPT|nr:CLUMA_CG002425, isoform A [Clunio marinus]
MSLLWIPEPFPEMRNWVKHVDDISKRKLNENENKLQSYNIERFVVHFAKRNLQRSRLKWLSHCVRISSILQSRYS